MIYFDISTRSNFLIGCGRAAFGNCNPKSSKKTVRKRRHEVIPTADMRMHQELKEKNFQSHVAATS